MEGSDVCFAPVLSISEVASHPHNAERQTFQSLDGVMHPRPLRGFHEPLLRYQRHRVSRVKILEMFWQSLDMMRVRLID